MALIISSKKVFTNNHLSPLLPISSSYFSNSLLIANTTRSFSKVSEKDLKIPSLITNLTASSKSRKRLYYDFMELTKFKLSLLNSLGAYTMFYFHAPIAGVGIMSSMAFIFAT
jgi:hypothetical protein